MPLKKNQKNKKDEFEDKVTIVSHAFGLYTSGIIKLAPSSLRNREAIEAIYIYS
jgi:hypothetical protein